MKSKFELIHCMANHSIEQIQGAQTNTFVLVVQALQHQVLMGLHAFRVGFENLGHGQESQVLHWMGG